MTLKADIARSIKGDVVDDSESLIKYSRDTSIFERKPALIVFPKDADDVAETIKVIRAAKDRGENVALAARSAGTDMTGGSLTDSVSLVFTKYMNHIGEITDDYAVTEPGVYFRDFDKATTEKNGKILPSYPASRDLCAMGGIVSNNSGGELTLQYGKTARYVRELDVVLSDGSKTTIRPLNMEELRDKESGHTFESEVYRRLHGLIESHYDAVRDARPHVTKNSAGYALWNVYDRDQGVFDLTQLITGSQGTLAVVTKAKLGLVKLKPNHSMLVIFLNDNIDILPEIVKRVLAHKPESFESYDDKTFKLAVRFAPQMIMRFGLLHAMKLGFSFLPEAWMVLTGGVPKLVLMAEFAEDTHAEALAKAEAARADLADLHLRMEIEKSDVDEEKFWSMRRDSFALLRKNLQGLYASPFIDDFAVSPETYPKFLPELNELLSHYNIIYTMAGHIGDGNFHIIPLMNLSRETDRKIVLELQPKVYEIVTKYKGTITGEHNDGIIRTPYLSMMYGAEICDLFAETKKIFDPQGILNPRKKVGGTIADIQNSMITHS